MQQSEPRLKPLSPKRLLQQPFNQHPHEKWLDQHMQTFPDPYLWLMQTHSKADYQLVSWTFIYITIYSITLKTMLADFGIGMTHCWCLREHIILSVQRKIHWALRVSYKLQSGRSLTISLSIEFLTSGLYSVVIDCLKIGATECPSTSQLNLFPAFSCGINLNNPFIIYEHDCYNLNNQ